MALAKSVFVDKTEVVSFASTFSTNDHKTIQVRTATSIREDGIELSKSFHRHTLPPGVVAAGSTALTVTDVSKEDAEVQTLFNTVMTDEVKEAFRLHSVGIRSTR